MKVEVLTAHSIRLLPECDSDRALLAEWWQMIPHAASSNHTMTDCTSVDIGFYKHDSYNKAD